MSCEVVDERGLTAAQVAVRVAAGLTNDVPVRPSRSVWVIIRANVLTRINAILLVLFGIVMSTGSFFDGLFGAMIAVNSAVGVIQELRAKRTLDRLAIIGQVRPRVRRDGRVLALSPGEVVADDVIEVGPGDQIVVDGDLLDAASLEVDESLLTGEADPVLKTAGEGVLSGSFVVAGSGRYRATAVGRDAYAARLAHEAAKFTLVKSDLMSGINRVLRVITWLLIPVGAVSVYNQLSGSQPLPEALRGMVAALAPMVPEGLVLLTSIAFAVGVVRLGRYQCLVNELPAIEGLARVDVVCTDKTGTLTEQGMNVSAVHAVGGGLSTAAHALAALAAVDPRPNPSMRAIRDTFPDAPDWRATEVAPFSSARKWGGVDFGPDGAWVLGAPDVLLRPDHDQRPLADQLAADGRRVLLLGRADAPLRHSSAAPPVRASAFVVLDQHIRPDARGTLDYFTAERVAVKVLSGDSAASVAAVASTLGLPHAGQPLDARELPDDPGSLAQAAEHTTVVGRATPQTKRTFVRALKSRGHTVAMTGDGVNDVLALKSADVGVAMGAGSPAARAVAQFVLLGNSFATLPHIVAEGRRVIGNIERVAALFLTKTVYSVLLALVVGLPGVLGLSALPFPFYPRHVTMTSWFTIGIPAFVLSLAPNHAPARRGFVGRVMRFAIPSGCIAALACLTAYALTYPGSAGATRAHTQASTTALLTLTVISLWVLAIVARPHTLSTVALVVTMCAATALMFTAPLTQRLFLLDPTNAGFTVIGLTCALAGMVLVEIAWRVDRGLRLRATAVGA